MQNGMKGARGDLARVALTILLSSITLLVVPRRAAAQAPGATIIKLTISPASGVVRSGGTADFKALADFDDGTLGIDVTSTVTWSSTNPSLASVTGGRVSGIVAGTATIGATDPATGVTSDRATGLVRVVGTLSAISLLPSERILPLGQGTLYHAFGSFEGGITLDISKDVTWALSDPSVAKINPNGRAKGRIPGTTIVSATDRPSGLSTSDSGDDVPLMIVGAMMTLEISPPKIALRVGQTALVKAQALFDSQCKLLNYGSRLKWSSSNPAVATVDNEGLVSCVGDGTTVVSVRDRRSDITSTETGGDGTVICGGTLAAILVTPIEFVLPVGEERDLKATYVFADGSSADGTSQVVWSSSDPDVAKITVASSSSAGEAKGVARGQAIITAFDPLRNVSSSDSGGRDGILDVPGALVSLTLLPAPPAGQPLFVELGGSLKLTAQASYEGGLTRAVNKLVAWSSSDENVIALGTAATCSPIGAVDFASTGTATVAVTYPKAGGPGSVTAEREISVQQLGSPAGAFLDLAIAPFF